MASFAPPKGMRDFYPEDHRARKALFEAWCMAGRQWGFETYDAPVVETLELLERKAGEEIAEQIYTFEDKGGNRLALRPELTPSLARMIIARQGGFGFPLKWSAIAQCFRYERMQRGRKREHFQWNLDIVGEPSILAEAEVIGAAVGALRQLGLTEQDFQVRVGSRAMLAELMKQAGVREERLMACYMALDKRDKIGEEAVAEMLGEAGLEGSSRHRVLEVTRAADFHEAARQVGPDHPSALQVRELFDLVEPLGLQPYLTFDLGVIRGLGYYTGIVFEAFDTERKLRAIFGGGRYDNLLSDLGGQTMPSVGLGFGDVVVMELLADRGKSPAGERTIAYAVGFMDEAASRRMALEITRGLREAGRACDLGMHAEKARKFFNRANRIGARHAVYIGPEEAERRRFEIKPMGGGQPVRLEVERLPEGLPE